MTVGLERYGYQETKANIDRSCYIIYNTTNNLCGGIMPSKIRNEEFMRRAISIAGFNSITKNTSYKSTKSKVELNCLIHGVYFQTAGHLFDGHHCKKCGGRRTSKALIGIKRKPVKKISHLEFMKNIVRAGGFAEITKNTIYVSNKSKIEFNCSKHGLYKQRADHFYSGSHCQKCAIDKSKQFNINRFTSIIDKNISNANEYFIQASKKAHGDKYDYSLSEYKGSSTSVKIICKDHGIFEQIPLNHIRGSGCKNCVTNGYKFSDFKEKCSTYGVLYLIKCFNDNEVFYKVGITSKSVKDRYKSKDKLPYNYLIIAELKGTPEWCWLEESTSKRMSHYYRVSPINKFGGSITECFSKVLFNGVWYE